jgi:hypothetical protein
MGRAEDRRKMKKVKKKLTENQFNQLHSAINQEFINEEVTRQMTSFKDLFSDCLIEALKKNNICLTKITAILDDTKLIMVRRVEERRSGQV